MRGGHKAIALAAALGCVMVCLSAAGPAAAHPGGLNAQGCHNNKKTGEYHCHKAQSETGGVVKMSKSGICHDPSSPWYAQTQSFTPFESMEQCLRAGGRPPKGM